MTWRFSDTVEDSQMIEQIGLELFEQQRNDGYLKHFKTANREMCSIFDQFCEFHNLEIHTSYIHYTNAIRFYISEFKREGEVLSLPNQGRIKYPDPKPFKPLIQDEDDEKNEDVKTSKQINYEKVPNECKCNANKISKFLCEKKDRAKLLEERKLENDNLMEKYFSSSKREENLFKQSQGSDAILEKEKQEKKEKKKTQKDKKKQQEQLSFSIEEKKRYEEDYNSFLQDKYKDDPFTCMEYKYFKIEPYYNFENRMRGIGETSCQSQIPTEDECKKKISIPQESSVMEEEICQNITDTLNLISLNKENEKIRKQFPESGIVKKFLKEFEKSTPSKLADQYPSEWIFQIFKRFLDCNKNFTIKYFTNQQLNMYPIFNNYKELILDYACGYLEDNPND